jgi:cell division GTPase FtsZ
MSNDFDIPDIEYGVAPDSTAQTTGPEPDAKEVAVKFGIIGAGQGGSRIADAFYQMGYRRVCAVNTTAQDFLGLSIPEKSQKVLESPGGAGKDPALGAQVLAKSTEEVFSLMRQTFGEDVDRILVCAGMGGGTGSGFAYGLVKIARHYLQQLGKEPKVGMIVTLPKKAEGGKVQGNAHKVITQICEAANKKEISPFVLVDNECINNMFPNLSAKSFWQTANRNIAGLFDIFNILARQQSAYTTFDRADYQSVLDSGVMIFGATKLAAYKHENDISDGLRKNLSRTLLAEMDITKATHTAAILCAPDEILGNMPQSHIDHAFVTLERILQGENRNLTVHQGVYEVKKDGLFLYTMVGGLEIPKARLDMLKIRAGQPT